MKLLAKLTALGLGAALSVSSAIVHADSSDPICKAPGPVVATDKTGDETGDPANSELDITAVDIAEPYVSATDSTLVFTIKIANAEGLTTPTPNAAWNVQWTSNDTTGAPHTFYVQFSTFQVPTGGFDWGFVDKSATGGNLSSGQCAVNATTGACPEVTGGFDGANKQIVLKFNTAKALAFTPNSAGTAKAFTASFGAGTELDSVAATTQLLVGAAGTGLINTPDTSAVGTYTVMGEAYCAPNTAPTAKLAADKTTGDKPLTVAFSGLGSTDPDAGDKVASYTFNFGDGSAAVTNTTGTATYTYLNAGTFTPTLTVTDTHKAASAAVSGTAITPVNEAPTVTLAASPTAPTTGQAVTFTATGADANSNDVSTLTYSFDMDGDGKYEIDYGTAKTQQETFSKAGDYTVGVKVKDSGGLTGTNTVKVTVADPKVDAFTFAERKDVDVTTVITSEVVTLSGTAGASFPISVSGGTSSQYSLNGGSFTSAAGTVKTGDKLAVRQTSSSAYSTKTTETVTVGSYSTTFDVTTKAQPASTTPTSGGGDTGTGGGTTAPAGQDHVPDAFDFGTQQNVAPGTSYTSSPVTPANYDNAPVTASQGITYSIDGGGFVSGSSTISKGQSIRVKLTSSTSSLGYAKGYVTIGGVKGTYTLRTRK